MVKGAEAGALRRRERPAESDRVPDFAARGRGAAACPGLLFTRRSDIVGTAPWPDTSRPSILAMTKPEKRRDLERALLAAGCSIKSASGGHDKWICPCSKHSANIPRHGVISPGVVASTKKRLTCLPEGWLK